MTNETTDSIPAVVAEIMSGKARTEEAWQALTTPKEAKKSMFKKAERKRVKGRIAIEGPTGSGKTFTALSVAQDLAKHYGEKVAVIDTERESASIYADMFAFDVVELDTFSVQNYIAAINAAADAGYGVLVIDSLSHAWAGKGGVLEAVDQAAKRMKNPNSYMAWRQGTTIQEDLIESILRYPGHVIVTMRSKMDYVQDKDKDGKTVIRKIGMAPVQRDGLEYEFTIVGDMDVDHNLVITKSRCAELADQVFPKPGKNFTGPLIAWLDGGKVEEVKGDEPERPEDDGRGVVVGWIVKHEAEVYDNAHAIHNARKKYAGADALDQVQSVDDLKSYARHIQEKIKEAKKSA